MHLYEALYVPGEGGVSFHRNIYLIVVANIYINFVSRKYFINLEYQHSHYIILIITITKVVTYTWAK